jgi:hypothetical protein
LIAKNRCGGVSAAAACDGLASAGNMASNQGKAIATPVPRNIARREICFRKIVPLIVSFLEPIVSPCLTLDSTGRTVYG